MTCDHPPVHRQALQPSGWTNGTELSFFGTGKTGHPAVLIVCVFCSTFWSAKPGKVEADR